MKKKTSLLLLLIVAAAALFGSIFATSGCRTTDDAKSSAEDYVDYYGCPNSDRVKKLNLKRRRES